MVPRFGPQELQVSISREIRKVRSSTNFGGFPVNRDLGIDASWTDALFAVSNDVVSMPKDLIAKLLSKTKPEIGPPEEKHFQFVVILVDDKSPEQLPTIASSVMETLVEHHANISNVTPAVFVALLGVPFPEDDSPRARRELVVALLQESGERIRIAHGECNGTVGMFGGHGRWTYGAVIPRFTEILRKLLDTPFGAAFEAF